MKSYITTIEELKGKPVSELHTIFGKASQIAWSEKHLPHEQELAKLTIENIRYVLQSRKAPGP